MTSVLAAGIGGVMIGLAFPPTSFWPGVFVGMILILPSTARRGLRIAGASGLAAGICGHAVVFSWLWPGLAQFANAGPPATAGYVGLFVVYHGAQLAMFGLVATFRADQRRALWRRSGDAAAAWVVVEWCFPKIIPWTLADGLSASLQLRQASDLAGPYGLSFLIVATGSCFASALDPGCRRRAHAAVAGAAAVSLMLIYGTIRIAQFDSNAPAATLSVTAVQGGIGLHDPARQQSEFDWKTYESLTLDAVRKAGAGLIVWPETTLRTYLLEDGDQVLRLRGLVSRLQQALLLGALDPAPDGERNTAFLFRADLSNDAAPIQMYRKKWLVPFAEYVPGAEMLPLLGNWRTTGRFVPGDSRGPLDLGNGTMVAPAICFEALRPGMFNQMVRDGAAVLVNLSDDGWFADTPEPQQHLQSALMRAVETRRWLIRASDSGISAVIDPAGRVVRKLDVGEIGVLHAEVPLERGESAYVKTGDWIVAVSVLLLAARMVGAPREK